MLRGGTGQEWRGTYELTFKHHSRTEALRRSREAGCSICVALANELKHEVDLLDDQEISIEASLSELKGGQWTGGVYRLDFVLEKRRTRTFVLRPTGLASTSKARSDGVRWLRTPKSYNTSSDEVFQLAYSWLSTCSCAKTWDPQNIRSKWYPKRLLELKNLRAAIGIQHKKDLTIFSMNANLELEKVKLIETADVGLAALRSKHHNRYVTLSHCWGKPRSVQGQLKLTAHTEAKFKDGGIELRAFSKTFRDAITFACRLPNVGYIWIDSMCIKQRTSDPEEDQFAAEQDWLEQSQVMDKVYRESFLNISATAALDGDKGLFFPRRPEYLWEDEVNLNLVGLPGHNYQASTSAESINGEPKAPGTKKRTSGHPEVPNKSQRTNGVLGFARGRDRVSSDHIRRCIITDVSLWEDLVDHAPVNQRAWVLQERLMAPRVLHFCANQIAWECSEGNDAEGHPEGIETLAIRSGAIVDEGRLKSLDPQSDGKKLRDTRLNGFPDPDEGLPNLYSFELWKRIVEVYSKTKLTMSRDKLIALSGIARWFHQELFADTKNNASTKYIAGMWNQYLESQLLWRVEPVFKDGVFSNHATRHPLRAPSFSWASLDVPQGIVYGEATEYWNMEKGKKDLLFKVEKAFIDLSRPEDEFGLIEGGNGYLQLKVQHLRKIKLRKLELPRRVPYGWRLIDGELSQGEHTNVYLDTPESDVEIFSSGTSIPFAIRDADINVPLPDSLTDLELLSSETPQPRSLHSLDMSTFIHIIRIRQVQSRIQDTFYPVDASCINPETVSFQRAVLRAELNNWIAQAPRYPHPTLVTFQFPEWFQIAYSHALLLLYRPSPACPDAGLESLQICADAAISLISSYSSLYAKNKITYTWIALHSLFMASITMLYTWWVNPEIRKATSKRVAKSNIMSCLALFEVMADSWPLATRCYEIVDRLGTASVALFDSPNGNPPAASTPTEGENQCYGQITSDYIDWFGTRDSRVSSSFVAPGNASSEQDRAFNAVDLGLPFFENLEMFPELDSLFH
ncbi:hypothetical protein SLS57_000624 [Botryosphaeria dothidea]